MFPMEDKQVCDKPGAKSEANQSIKDTNSKIISSKDQKVAESEENQGNRCKSSLSSTSTATTRTVLILSADSLQSERASDKEQQLQVKLIENLPNNAGLDMVRSNELSDNNTKSSSNNNTSAKIIAEDKVIAAEAAKVAIQEPQMSNKEKKRLSSASQNVLRDLVSAKNKTNASEKVSKLDEDLMASSNHLARARAVAAAAAAAKTTTSPIGAQESPMRSHSKDPMGIFKLSTSPINMFMNNKVSSSNADFNANQSADQMTAAAAFAEIAARASSGSGSGSRSSSSQQFLTLSNNQQFPVTRRRVRDSGSFLFMLAYLAFLIYIIWEGFSSREANVQLIIHGHDSYGNICGLNNKPIRFVEKSGKNFTTKPYTKYTLINAQFERYIALTESADLQLADNQQQQRNHQLSSMMSSPDSPSVNGQNEFYYVKESLLSNQSIKKSIGLNSIANLQQRQRLIAPNIRRFPRSSSPSASMVSFDDDDNNGDDQNTAQSLLKSALMYQYPPKYESSVSMVAPTITTTGQRGQQQHRPPSDFSGGSFTEVISSSSPRMTTIAQTPIFSPKIMINDNNNNEQQQQQARSTNAWQRNLNSAPLATGSSNNINSLNNNNLLVQDDLMGSQSIASPASSLSSSLSSNKSSLPSHVLTNQMGSLKPTRGNGMNNSILTNTELDSNNNNNNNLDHVLISRTQFKQQNSDTHSTSRIPEIMNQNEASQQLLYLTECVDSCPADHLEFIFFRCLPKNWRFSLFPNAINVTRTFIDDIITDIGHCHRELIYTFSFALALSIVLLILLRFLASFIIWSSIAFLITLITSTAAYSWINYYYQIVDLNDITPHETSYSDRLALSDKWLIGSIFLTFMSLAGIVTVIFMRRRILLVTTLFRESGKAIADMPMLLLQPLLTFSALILIVAGWCFAMIYLQSIKQPVIDRTTGLVVYRAETLYKVMKWYHIFAFLWVSHFAIACQHYVIGASVTKWYFSSDRYRLASPIGSSVSELILYYLGSVALGSFLVAVFKVIRIITKQIQFLIQRNCITSTQTSRSSLLPDSLAGVGTNGQSMTMTTATTSCCGSLGYVWRLFVWFFDKIVVIISRDAYVEIAIHGDSFIKGAQRAFNVLASNPLRLLAIKTVSSLLLTISKICVVFGTISMATLLIEEKSRLLNYSWSPIIISAMFAYVVAHWFLSVYEMVIDALFICYCEDYERSKLLGEIMSLGNGGNNRALIGSQFMARILNNNNVNQQLY